MHNLNNLYTRRVSSGIDEVNMYLLGDHDGIHMLLRECWLLVGKASDALGDLVEGDWLAHTGPQWCMCHS